MTAAQFTTLAYLLAAIVAELFAIAGSLFINAFKK